MTRQRTKQLGLLEAEQAKPETRPLFSEWRYDLPDEEADALRRRRQAEAEKESEGTIPQKRRMP